MMSKLNRIYPDLWTAKCDMEQAQIYWEHKETERAMFLMKNCIAKLDTKVIQKLIVLNDVYSFLYTDY